MKVTITYTTHAFVEHFFLTNITKNYGALKEGMFVVSFFLRGTTTRASFLREKGDRKEWCYFICMYDICHKFPCTCTCNSQTIKERIKMSDFEYTIKNILTQDAERRNIYMITFFSKRLKRFVCRCSLFRERKTTKSARILNHTYEREETSTWTKKNDQIKNRYSHYWVYFKNEIYFS